MGKTKKSQHLGFLLYRMLQILKTLDLKAGEKSVMDVL